MPHQRRRYLGENVKKALAHFPVLGLMGQRQVGKTTLASLFAKEYATLDIRQQLDQCDKDPESFLKNRHHPFVVDECQMSPPLFPAIKESVRLMPRPGRFILTGSVRFASRKLIRESLTGRIALYELLPFSITESHGEPLNPLPLTILDHPRKGNALFDSLAKRRDEKIWKKRMAAFLKAGGLPGVCFARDEDIKRKKWESYLETILLRDLQLILRTTLSYPTLRNLVAQIAYRQGLPMELSDLSRQTGISAITLKKLLDALQGLYLIREARGLGTRNKSSYFFEDQGFAHHLTSGWNNPLLDMVRLLFANVRHQFSYASGSELQLFHFKTRGGASLPLVCQNPKGMVGYACCLEPSPTSSVLASARSFIKARPKALVLIAHQGSEIREWGNGIWGVPLHILM